MASDSQATEGGGLDVRHPVQKLYPLLDRFVWGCAGSGAVTADIGQKLDANVDMLKKSPDMPNSLASLIKPVLESHYQRYVHVPGTVLNPPATTTLFAGLDEDARPVLIEVDSNCTLSDYAPHGKHAIGSGGGFAYMANALMSHYPLSDRPVSWGKVVAYRALNAVIHTSASGVGPPIQLWSVTPDGCQRADDAELKQLEDFVGGWQSLEIETLEQLMTPADTEPSAPLPPEVSQTET